MLLKLHHLGLIEHAELDLRPLTVFVGENGTNKTWAAACAHGLFRSVSRQLGSFVLSANGSNLPHFEAIRQAVQSIKTAAGTGVPVALGFDRPDPDEIGGSGEWLRSVLGIPPSLLRETANATLSIHPSDWFDPTEKLIVEQSGAPDLLTAAFVTQNRRLIRRRVPLAADPEIVVGFLGQLVRAGFDRVVFFPADRNAITSLPGIGKALEALWEAGEDQPFAWRDFVEFLVTTRTPTEAAEGLLSLSSKLHDILGGSAVSTQDTYGFQVSDGPLFPMHSVASLSRTMSGVDLYLQRLAQPGDVIIIDELEMNAHPKAQLALVELIAMMVQRNLRVIFTTHSPYIVDHLNTLMYAAGLPDDRKQTLAKDFALQSAEAFISPDKVAAYCFAKTTPTKVEVSDVLKRDTGRIDWRTFSRISNLVGKLWDNVDDARHAPVAVSQVSKPKTVKRKVVP